MRVYLDSVIPIYYLEGAATYKARATARLGALWAAGDTLVVSDLVRLECRLLPTRLGDAVRLADFDNFFAQPNIVFATFTRAVFDRATRILATHPFKLADALHLAAAAEAGCDRFLTNNSRLSAFRDIPVELLP